MKLHISQKQLNELSEEGKERYSDFCSKSLKIVVGKSDDYRKNSDGDLILKGTTWKLPLLSIGQMIEFLTKNEEGERRFLYTEKNPRRAVNENYEDISSDSRWWWTCWWGTYGTFSYKELADALWEPVKVVLEK